MPKSIFFLATLAVTLSIFPTIYLATKAPTNTVFSLVHNNQADYYYYLSLMHQGYEGRWLLTSRSTPENFPPMFIQTFFAFLGHMAGIFSGDLALTYTVSRVILGFILLVLIYGIARRMLQSYWQVLFACLLAYFGSAFWFFKGNSLVTYLPFWTEFDPVFRTTFLPHHLMGNIGVLASLVSLILYIESQGKKIKYLFLCILFGLISGLSNPASLLNYGITLAGAFPILLLHQSTKLRLFLGITYLGLAVCFGLTLFYFLSVRDAVFPWTTYRDLASTFDYQFPSWEYLAGMGFTAVLAIIGVLVLVKEKKFSVTSCFILSWGITPFLSIFVLSNIFHIPNSHFFQSAHYIPLSLLASYGIGKIIQSLPNKRIKLVKVSLVVMCAIYFAVPWYFKIDAEIKRFGTHYFNIFLPKELFPVFDYLNRNTKPEEVVLSGNYLGSLIPAYTHNRAVVGHPENTYHLSEKIKDMNALYKQDDPSVGQMIINKYHISYIVFSLDAPSPNSTYTSNLHLQLVYQNTKLSLYQAR